MNTAFGRTRRVVSLCLLRWGGLFLLATALAPLGGWAMGQGKVDQVSGQIHTIFVAPLAGADGTEAIRSALIERLRRQDRLRVVADERTADAVLRVTAVIWPTGSVSLNPRSKAASTTNYQGYASAELTDRAQQTVWSYLATPSRFRFAAITDDLASQLTTRLLEAAQAGFAQGSAAASNSVGRPIALRAAGATFPAPLYLKWFESFQQQPGGFPITYGAVGSVAGLEQLAAGQIELAASDIPQTAGTAEAASEKELLRLPTVVGGVVPIYNLPGLGQELKLTPELLAAIYSGTIQRWNDPRIREWNRGTRLPDAAIVVVHRSDGSGTTFVWTSFLASTGAAWTGKVGATLDWPVGVGERGSEGVAGQVAATKDAIGYVELSYAIQHHLNYAGVRNSAGRFIRADLASIAAAAANAPAGDTGAGGSLLNAAGADAYPISAFTYFLVRKTGGDAHQREELSAFLHWMLGNGQKQCSALGYAPLPRALVGGELQALEALR